MSDTTAEVVDLLRHLIVNACVNDGTPESGHEARSSDLLAAYLDVPGIEFETFEPVPGRRSLLARLGHGDGARPGRSTSLLLMGHTDVVPVEENQWTRDPFGGELVDGWVWGRGAVDMLNLTASMAVALRHLATDTRRRPFEGDLTFLAVADEEASGTHGAQWLTENQADAVRADAVITESGGIPIPTVDGIRLPVIVAEKGTYWCRLTVRGTPGHGSRPLRTDNALVKAAEIVRRLAGYRPRPVVPDAWRLFVEGIAPSEDLRAALTDPDRIDEICESLPVGLAREAHASTHLTCSPTVCRSGEKTNVIPGTATVDVDFRTLPGQSVADVESALHSLLGEFADDVEVTTIDSAPASSSPAHGELWTCLSEVANSFYAGSTVIPMLSVGATDARYFRRLGIPSYGFGMFSSRLSIDDYAAMFHGNDEKVDVDSLALSTRLWEAVAHRFLS